MRKGRIARALTLALISPGESPKSAFLARGELWR